MTDREILAYCLRELQKGGAAHGQCQLERSEKHEMNVEAGELNLIRTVFSANLDVIAIKDGKKGTIGINKLDKEAIDRAIADVLAMADSAEEDAANAIAEKQGPQQFKQGNEKPDMELMYERLSAFLQQVKAEFPKTNLENTYLDFTHTQRLLANTNGSDLEEHKGLYKCDVVFTTKDGDKSSSFNYTSFSSKNLGEELLKCATLHTLLEQSSEQTETKRITEKFTGDILVTPDCMQDVISFLVDVFLRDGSLIAGTSVFKDSLDKQIADPKFTLHSRPVAPEITNGYFVTKDGFVAKNSTLVEKGILRSFLLSLYGANKTGQQRAVNHGEAYVVEPGDQSFEELVRGVKRGILLARFSGGYPSQNGDFSGVAKNSYYIEDGKIQYPVSEVMVAGNLTEMLQNIVGISKEQINFGHCIMPWVCFGGITVSGQ